VLHQLFKFVAVGDDLCAQIGRPLIEPFSASKLSEQFQGGGGARQVIVQVDAQMMVWQRSAPDLATRRIGRRGNDNDPGHVCRSKSIPAAGMAYIRRLRLKRSIPIGRRRPN